MKVETKSGGVAAFDLKPGDVVLPFYLVVEEVVELEPRVFYKHMTELEEERQRREVVQVTYRNGITSIIPWDQALRVIRAGDSGG